MAPSKNITFTASDPVCSKNCWLEKFSMLNKGDQGSPDHCVSPVNVKEFNKGAYLIKNGDAVSGIYCIKSGHVKVFREGPRDKEFILWIAGQGDIIGLNSFISGEPHSFSATAIDKVSVCFIPTSELNILLNEKPLIFVSLMEVVCRKLNFVEHRITSLTGKSIRAQCAEILISLADQNTADSAKNLCINYSVKDLASLVGTTRNYLYKILMEFTKSEILSVRKRKFIVRDLKALTLIANGNDKQL